MVFDCSREPTHRHRLFLVFALPSLRSVQFEGRGGSAPIGFDCRFGGSATIDVS